MSQVQVRGRYIVLFDNAVIPPTVTNGMEFIRESDYRKRMEEEGRELASLRAKLRSIAEEVGQDPDGPAVIDSLPSIVRGYRDGCEELRAKLAEAEKATKDMEARKDAAYEERNKVVAALAKCFPSGIAKTAIPGWSEDWHGCVYIDLPTGQVSWHYHDSQAALFAGLPPYTKPWDGHDTPEKYRRVAALSPKPDAGRAEGVKCPTCGVRATMDSGVAFCPNSMCMETHLNTPAPKPSPGEVAEVVTKQIVQAVEMGGKVDAVRKIVEAAIVRERNRP